ncbi:MAG TPA: hypothetical protein VKZ18_15530 [Polyangia bacterium]|nr:hypothetical protein [Polyangia bacterium]
MSTRETIDGGNDARATSGADALAQAESDVERARERVTSSVLALRDEVVRRTDWRSWVRRRPFPFFGAAIAIGFWLGYRRYGR